MELPKIALSGSLRIEAGDKLTIGNDPTIYRVDAVDKHGDITGFSIVAAPSAQETWNDLPRELKTATVATIIESSQQEKS